MKNAKTEKALSSLEWAIAQSSFTPKQADEFTVEEFAKLANIPLESARGRLTKMVKSGMLMKRQILIKSHQTNVFKKAE